MTDDAFSRGYRGDGGDHPFRKEIARIFGVPTIMVGVLLIAVALWALWDSMGDAGGERHGVAFAFVVPGIFVAWVLISALFTKMGQDELYARIILGCFVVQLAIIAAVMIGLAIIWFLPGNQELLAASRAANGGVHEVWSEPSLLVFLPLYLLGSYGLAGLIALGTALVVMLPGIAIKSPEAMLAGSPMQLIESARARHRLTAFLFVGLSLVVLGLLVAGLLGGLSGPEDARRWFDSFRGYDWSVYYPFGDRIAREMTFGFLGCAMVVTGISFMIMPIAAMLRARSRDAKSNRQHRQ